jgi:AhpD family alkylhydroperoxidase
MIDIDKLNASREKLNTVMKDSDNFFKEFGNLDDNTYSKGAIPKKYKELTGLSISVLTRCEECIAYHMQGCMNENASKQEIIEAIKIGVIGGGSITYPSARYAFNIMEELKIL